MRTDYDVDGEAASDERCRGHERAELSGPGIQSEARALSHRAAGAGAGTACQAGWPARWQHRLRTHRMPDRRHRPGSPGEGPTAALRAAGRGTAASTTSSTWPASMAAWLRRPRRHALPRFMAPRRSDRMQCRWGAYVGESGGRRIDPNSGPISGAGQGKSAISLAELTRSTARVTESIPSVAW